MEAKFYKSRSGSREVEELFKGSREQAESFQKLLNEYTRFHLAQARLKELQPQLDEQKEKVNKLSQELEKAGKQKNPKQEYKAVQERFIIESVALDELARCVNVLNGVKQPEFPSWLVSFLNDVVS